MTDTPGSADLRRDAARYNALADSAAKMGDLELAKHYRKVSENLYRQADDLERKGAR